MNKRFEVQSPPTLKNQLVSWFDDKKTSGADAIGWNSQKKKKKRTVERRLMIFVCSIATYLWGKKQRKEREEEEKGNPTTNARNFQFLVCFNDSFSFGILFHKKNNHKKKKKKKKMAI